MPTLPCELLDHIVDILHHSQFLSRTPLRKCCLVSKSWVPRTRRHLFAEIDFQTAKSLKLWKKSFPDPSTSPARYVKVLSIGGPGVVEAADGEAGGWIGGFSRVVHLKISGKNPHTRGWRVAFVVLRGFSPVLKSLDVCFVAYQPSMLFDLVLSFPLLEDLFLALCTHPSVRYGGYSDGPPAITQPSNLPAFSGSLVLALMDGMGPIVQRFLPLPGGVYFRKLTLMWWQQEDIPMMMALVEKCSHTLESLDIAGDPSGVPIGHLLPQGCDSLLFLADPRLALFDLSKATRLGDVIFRPGSLKIKWITSAVRIVTHKHRDLRQIWIDVGCRLTCSPSGEDIKQTIGEGTVEQWLNLDRTLVNLWESLSIRTNVIWTRGRSNGVVADHIGSLLPAMTKRGMVTINMI